MGYQSEAELELQFIDQLNKQGYSTVSIPDYDTLLENFKVQFEAFNADKLDKPLTDKEWERILNLMLGKSVFQSAKILRDKFVLEREDARRRFDEALTVLKKDFTKEQLKETTAYQAMERIGMLYKIEEMIRDKSPEERYEERQKQAKPLLEAFFEWIHTLEDSVDRSSLIGEAVLYTLNQEVYLKRYLEDGHLSIDNLAAERALKNFAIVRRNWLFAKSIRGAQASATVYSVTETAMLNGLKPYNYLTYVMERMKEFGPFPEKEAMRELLPWSNSLPADCHSKLKK